MRRKKQQQTNISNLIYHIKIPISVAQRWWCSNVVWRWWEFGHGAQQSPWKNGVQRGLVSAVMIVAFETMVWGLESTKHGIRMRGRLKHRLSRQLFFFLLFTDMNFCFNVVVPLSIDHKPDRSNERQRIEQAGGFIIWTGNFLPVWVYAIFGVHTS